MHALFASRNATNHFRELFPLVWQIGHYKKANSLVLLYLYDFIIIIIIEHIKLAVHALFASCNATNHFREFFPLVWQVGP